MFVLKNSPSGVVVDDRLRHGIMQQGSQFQMWDTDETKQNIIACEQGGGRKACP